MKLDPRTRGVLTGKENLEHLYTFKDFPVFFGTVDTPAADDLHADMEWGIDPETGVVQLTKLIPLDILYSEQHVDGCGSTWKNYYNDLAEYIAAANTREVLEIGGGAGVLAEVALSKRPDLHWTIVEPNPTIAPKGNISVIKGFFDKSLIAGQNVDSVAFSQVMEHVYDPREFLSDIASFLKPGQKLIFAYPNLALWLDKKYTNALNFEHTMLLTDRHLDTMLPEHGFEITDKRAYLEHSFFYTAVRSAKKVSAPPMPNLYGEYKTLFNAFIRHHEKMIEDLNRQLRESTDEIYLFGAHIFSTFLFAFGLDKSRIRGILDNSPTKKGRRLYGTHYIVQNPSVLQGKSNATVILRAGHFNQEIKDGILTNVNPNVRFI